MATPRGANQVLVAIYEALNNDIRVNNVGGGGGGSTTPPDGRESIALVRNDYSSVNVTTGAYVQLLASLPDHVNQLYIFDSSGQTLVLAVGGSGSEVDQAYVVPGGNGELNLRILAGSRVSIKAVSGLANVGEINVTFLK